MLVCDLGPAPARPASPRTAHRDRAVTWPGPGAR